MPRRFMRKDNWEFGGRPAPEDRTRKPKSRKRRLATTLAFTTLFFAGASFAAVAGNLSARLEPDALTEESTTTSETDTAATTTDAAATPATDAAPAETSASPDAPAPALADTTPVIDDSVSPSAPAVKPAPADAAVSGAAAPDAPATKPGKRAAKQAHLRATHLRTVLLPKLKKAPAPEIEGPPNAATIWLNSPLPDPTPPVKRLSSKFAKDLKMASRAAGVNWAVMLGILRARGAKGHAPADRGTLLRLGARLSSQGPVKGDWARIVSYAGDTRFADKAAALARYDRAVGLAALVNGLESAKTAIGTRLLQDRTVSIYEGGRNDIIDNKVDVRVLALIAYLRESFGQVTVSSLISGHRLYARPGVVSAHIPGHAVDIAGLADTPIQGHQEPGGITERAVRDILLVPTEIMPRQVISLLGLGGPSFPMGDHYNHIHIGF